jgi:ubiquinone/menaquinone biosynthesis C-methylase UbiE
LADIGSGEGLLGFHAFDRIGPSLKVIFADVSAPMLDYVRERAVERGLDAQCSYAECGADSLAPIADSSVDVVTTRAVLAYVADKEAAFREFFRILRPGGRISIAEPILQEEAFFARSLRTQVEQSTNPHDLFLRLLHRWKAAQFPDTEEGAAKNPLVNFSERDLLNMVQRAGFAEPHLELHIDVKPSKVESWEVFTRISPHPWAPPLTAILAEFTPLERELFEKVLRPSIESGSLTVKDHMVYITAVKPPESPKETQANSGLAVVEASQS